MAFSSILASRSGAFVGDKFKTRQAACAFASSAQTKSEAFDLRSGQLKKFVGAKFVVKAEVSPSESNRGLNEKIGTAFPVDKSIFTVVQRKRLGLKKRFLELTKKVGIPALVSGALATVAAIQISSAFLEKLETVPFLSNFELIVGAAVSLNLAVKFFSGGEARARLESFLESTMDKIEGIGSEDLSDDGFSILDVTIRSEVDRYIQVQEIKDGFGSSTVVNTVNKELLITALSDFIKKRELKSRSIHAMLRNENERLKTAATKMKEVEKALDTEKLKVENQKKEIIRISGIASAKNAERREFVAKFKSLSEKMDIVTAELNSISAEKSKLQALKSSLEERVSETEKANLSLRQSVYALESSQPAATTALEAASVREFEQQLVTQRELTQERQASADAQRQFREQMEEALELLQADRDSAIESLDKLEAELTAAKTDMVTKEGLVNSLENSLRASERKVLQNNEYVSKLRAELESVEGQVADSDLQLAENRELLAQLEAERDHHVSEVVNLKQKLDQIHSEKENSALRIRELEEELERSETAAVATDQSADDLQSALKWSSVSATVEPLTHIIAKSPMVKAAVSRSQQKTASLAEFPVPGSSQESSQEDGFVSSDFESEPGTPRAPGSIPGDLSGDSAERKLTKAELMKYARSVRLDFVDISKPARDQPDAVSSFVAALVAKGGEEGWARKYVLESMKRELRKASKDPK